MKIRTVALATAFALCSGIAATQSSNTAGANSQAGVQAGIKTKNAKDGGTGQAARSNTPSPKDASTQGANTAGAAQKKGDDTSPGGTVKK
jgi:hypothetical protein